MMMRPRRYGTLNRCVARALSHTINDYYRHKNNNSTYQSNSNNENYNGETNVGCAVVFCVVFMIILLIVNING